GRHRGPHRSRAEASDQARRRGREGGGSRRLRCRAFRGCAGPIHMTVDADERFMRRALDLAERARGLTSPNPLVGAALVRGDAVVGEGFPEAAGRPHAEAVALAAAGERARGATLYVTLEPCAHHGRTPPCAPAVVAAGVSRVVVAIVDPDPRVKGR